MGEHIAFVSVISYFNTFLNTSYRKLQYTYGKQIFFQLKALQYIHFKRKFMLPRSLLIQIALKQFVYKMSAIFVILCSSLNISHKTWCCLFVSIIYMHNLKIHPKTAIVKYNSFKRPKGILRT